VNQKRFDELRREQEASLLQRKQQLAALYNEEIESWRSEVLAAAETQEDRKKNIMERAYALRDKREKTRSEYVKNALDAQWRDACDDARTLDSKAMLQYVKNERLAQIEEKIRRKERLSAQDNDFYEAWQQHLAEYDRKEEEKLKLREVAQQNTLNSIKSQVNNCVQLLSCFSCLTIQISGRDSQRAEQFAKLRAEELEEIANVMYTR
jgi:hypothetical protein